MIPLFKDVSELGSFIQALPNPGYVLMDGFHGAGKSTLARAVGAELNLPVFEVDRWVVRQIGTNANRYVDALDHRALINEMSLTGSGVVDGVTALDIALTTCIAVKAHIYVKRVDRFENWCDQDEIELENDIDQFVAPNELRMCLRRYHSTRRPQEVCDAIFVWQERE